MPVPQNEVDTKGIRFILEKWAAAEKRWVWMPASTLFCEL